MWGQSEKVLQYSCDFQTFLNNCQLFSTILDDLDFFNITQECSGSNHHVPDIAGVGHAS
jgi:hypothetical protein